MNGGVIQQFGTPDEIYERPANLFVAGFIGSPAMNLRRARLSTAAGNVEAVFASGVRLDVSDYPFAHAPVDGAEVIVGLRPEHFTLTANGPVAATFNVPVQYAERTGPDASAYFRFEDDLLALRVEPDTAARLSADQSVAVSYLKGKANLFDARAGQRM
jgi:multiple sugar transport system ATP-binding protein